MLCTDINFYKVLALPSSLSPHSIYFVADGDYTTAYVTDSSGLPKLISNAVLDNLTAPGGILYFAGSPVLNWETAAW